MIFSSLQFLIFWTLIVILNKFKFIKTPISIGLIGLIFYSFQGFFNFIVLFYIFLIVCLSYRLIHKTSVLIFLILLPLIIIKYSNFILSNLLRVDIEGFYFGSIAIPPGLSFVSFSAIALIFYLKNNVEKFDISLSYLYLFPQLIAGPIIRPAELIPQIKKINKNLDFYKDITLGIFIFSIGILIKIFIADSIADYIDPIFLNLENEQFSTKLISLFLFSQQIFFDFNGYTLMAIGVAKTLGFKLPENFNSPYLAGSVSQFWKRWHITLSNWIRDFIFIPLGGSRNGLLKNYVNILIAMSISGIWHGAGYNFLLWGFGHGLLIVFEKLIERLRFIKIHIYIKIIATYIIVTFLWLLFRVENLIDLKFFFNNISVYGLFSLNFIIFLFLILITNFSHKLLTVKFLEKSFQRMNKIFCIIFSISIIIFCIIISNGSSQKFIYFNF